jgi:hypothetical protein
MKWKGDKGALIKSRKTMREYIGSERAGVSILFAPALSFLWCVMLSICAKAE